ncbi:uncharacterized protein MJAP1_001092 [Malassezia japonica]|uniref:succinate-semialdehyde dehydrogenase [NAD(P)(+)] n=1 Tax=Malassezia japonica TaxID=223818 RepID=A0AAF0J9Z7_9BASI|nr:uncharacterized protein MJAP1_001092 [Malassezia japonica]WFD38144.1 hypothetical protein MJAP1_001092 [Malassezia japonica]
MVSAGSENPTFTATRTFAHMPKGVVKGGKEELKLNYPALLHDKSYINGKWVDAKSGKTQPVYNKATQQEIRTIPDQGKADTEEAIDAAYAAFATWSKRTPKERHDLLMELYRKLQEHADDLAHIIVAENGKSLADAKAEVAYSNSFVEWFAEEALRVYGRTVPSPVGSVRNVVIRQPVGVAGLIAPWNFPLGMITRKVGPALAAGCTVVIKAPHEAPFSAFALAQLAEEVGIPAGVLNVLVSARGENESQMGLTLCESPKVRKISFTGSTRVGKLLMGQSANTLKKLSMELGGNAPFIVFDDADVSLAVDNAIACKFRGGGQTCISANRIYVQDAVFDKFSKALAAKVADFKVGYGMDKDVRIGPLVNEAGQKKVSEHVAKIKEAGGEILVGGEKGEGLFFEPTVAVAPQGKHMPTDDEETFGPLAVLYRFSTEDEVLEHANDASVGLAGYFFSKDVTRCFRVGEALQVGMIGINTGMISQNTIPFGGVKESGFGREGGPTGINEYLVEKALVFGDIQ